MDIIFLGKVEYITEARYMAGLNKAFRVAW